MGNIKKAVRLDRRSFLKSSIAIAGTLAVGSPFTPAWAAAPLLKVESRTLEVNKKAAKVFSIVGANGKPGLLASEGDRLAGSVLNATSTPLQLHWHGQTKAPADQDRARPDGTPCAAGATDAFDFELTPGTHWMHSHSLTEQQLLAAPMITREKDASEVQDVVVMLHDFSFRTPEEILEGLGGSDCHGGHSGSMNQRTRMPGHGGHMMGGGMMMRMMTHTNVVKYDAYLANDRTLDDPDIIRVEKGGRVRLRIINAGTATAFFIATPGLTSQCVAVDGLPCQPVAAASYPMDLPRFRGQLRSWD